MKKLLSILSVLTIISPVFADDDPVTPSIDKTQYVAAASYVDTAISSVETSMALKQNKLSSDNGGNVTQTAGAFVTAITATNGAVAITRGDITIPVGSYASPTSRANIWVE